MSKKDQIEQILFEVIKELNDELPADQHQHAIVEAPSNEVFDQRRQKLVVYRQHVIVLWFQSMVVVPLPGR